MRPAGALSSRAEGAKHPAPCHPERRRRSRRSRRTPPAAGGRNGSGVSGSGCAKHPAPCHPERRRRSRRSRRTSLAAGGRSGSGVSGSGCARHPAPCHPERRRRSRRSRRTPPAAGGRNGGGVSGSGCARPCLRTPAPGRVDGRRRPCASGAGSCLRVAACGKAAVKGRWTNVSIGPAVHGSSSCGFALRNLHKSPGTNGWCRTASAGSRGLRPHHNPRRLVQVSCGWPQAGSASDLQAPAGRGRARLEGRPRRRCTFSRLLHGRGTSPETPRPDAPAPARGEGGHLEMTRASDLRKRGIPSRRAGAGPLPGSPPRGPGRCEPPPAACKSPKKCAAPPRAGADPVRGGTSAGAPRVSAAARGAATPAYRTPPPRAGTCRLRDARRAAPPRAGTCRLHV